MNIAAAMATLKYVRDVDATTRHVVLALACHADRDDSVAKLRVTDLAAELGVDRATVLRAVRRAEKAGHLTVEKVGYGGRLWYLAVAPAHSPETNLSARAHSLAEKAVRPRAVSVRPRTRVKRIFRFKDLEDGDAASLADTASGAACGLPAGADDLLEALRELKRVGDEAVASVEHPRIRQARNLAGVADARVAMREAAKRLSGGGPLPGAPRSLGDG